MEKSAGREVKMEVLSLGMPRTGTRSMRDAFRLLGYSDVHHGFDVVDYPHRSNGWEEVVDAKFSGKGTPPDRHTFDRLLGHCAATTDMPTAFFAEELLACYPEVKVILVERDLEKWYASFVILMNGIFDLGGQVMHALERFLGYPGLPVLQKSYLGYFRAKDKAQILENARLVYHEHYEWIRRSVPSERLLNYELGSGWKPLCDFLEKEEPPEGFPWINEAAALQEKMMGTLVLRIKQSALKLMWPSLSFLVILVAAYFFYSK